MAQKPIYLIGGPEPPLPIGARPEVDFTLAEPLWDGTLVIKAKVGDQLMVPDGGSGGAKGKGGGNLKRISDGNMGTVVETDLWKFQINGPDERIPERCPAMTQTVHLSCSSVANLCLPPSHTGGRSILRRRCPRSRQSAGGGRRCSMAASYSMMSR